MGKILDLNRAYIIQPHGLTMPVEPGKGKTWTLEELQSIVGGFIEVLTDTTKKTCMVLNEDGKRLLMEHNIVGTSLGWSMFGVQPTDAIVGVVLLCPKEQLE